MEGRAVEGRGAASWFGSGTRGGEAHCIAAKEACDADEAESTCASALEDWIFEGDAAKGEVVAPLLTL